MDMDTEQKKMIGVEVTNSGRNAVCLDENGLVTSSYRVSISDDEESIMHLGNLIRELKEKFGDFDQIGIAIPGLLNRKTKRVAYSTHIPEHTEVDLLSELEKIAGVKIHIENDANAAAFGEYKLGAGCKSKSMFYVTLGSGVGGAIIFDNKLWHGDSGFAGEFGYLTVDSEGGRLEDVTSSAGIISRTKGRFHQDPTSSLIEIGEEEITIEDIVEHAKKEDYLAQLMLERTGFYIGTAIAGVINLLNVEKIVINGIIMEAGDLVLDVIRERARELSFKPNFDSVEIVKGDFGQEASAIGAALLSQISDY
jgi:glucokinase